MFGRCEKYDGRVRDILKVCLMFSKMEECEEYEGLLPPPKMGTFSEAGSDIEEGDTIRDEEAISD